MPRTPRRKQILIIDPDLASATRLRGTLDGLGYHGITVKPADAITLARGIRLRLALLDDAIDATELTSLATQLHRAAVPVIVVYRPSETADTGEAKPPPISGVTAFLQKPWRTVDLVHLLYRFVGAPI